MNDSLICEVVSWHDEPRESTGWHRIQARALDDALHTVTGCHLPRPGSHCEFSGEWQETKYGTQFHVRAIAVTKPPQSAAGVQRWLEDRCEGIGKVKAAAILAAFGDDPAAMWTALQNDGPNALTRVPGISAEVSQHVHEQFEAEGTAREHYAMLRGWRLTQAQITRIVKHWPIAEACVRLYDDPYLLAQHISGFGFERADKIADEVGIPKHAKQRVRAGILHALGEAAQAGHVFGDQALFQNIAQNTLRMPFSDVVEVLKEMLQGKTIVSPDGARMYLPVYERAERGAAETALSLLYVDAQERCANCDAGRIDCFNEERVDIVCCPNCTHAGAPKRDWAKWAIEAVPSDVLQLEPQQALAINLAADMTRPLAFITGGPGTGKTTILQFAIEALRAQGIHVVLAAPTGKAARRMTEATGHAASTLHRLLGYQSESVIDCETCQRIGKTFELAQIDRCAVFIDEASMVDVQMWAALMEALERGGNCGVVRFVGDADQLPPVGPGQPFQDHLKALAEGKHASTVVRLQAQKRSDKASWVSVSAPLILAGQMPDLKQRHDFRFVDVGTRADLVPGAIEKLVRGGFDNADWSADTLRADYIPKKKAPTGVPAPVLIPQHKGLAGVAIINRLLSEHYNPHPGTTRDQDLVRIALEDGTDLRVGARVLVTKNDYQRGVRNGDTGVIERMEMMRDKRNEPRPKVFVRMDPDETTAREALAASINGDDVPETPLVEYSFVHAREQLVLAYAMTIHKSQGSQYPWIVVVCHSSHVRMLSRRLIYTALTRASEGVVIVGNREGLERAVNNGQELPRNTWLRQRLLAVTSGVGV